MKANHPVPQVVMFKYNVVVLEILQQLLVYPVMLSLL